MPDLRGFLPPRRGSIVKFLDDRLRDIDQATYKKNKPSEKFVPYAALEAIWTDLRLEEFVYLIHPGFDRNLIPFVRENLLRTLSILVYISWGLKDWELFGAIFLHHRNGRGMRDRLDDRIPHYTLGALTEFLDPIFAGRFLSERWTFYPIVLEEGKSQQFPGDWRLPFVNPESTTIGSGGYGQVTKEIVAKRQLVMHSHSAALPRALYQEEIPVARKRYAHRLDFQKEKRNLEFLRSSLTYHERVVSYISIVAVGNDYNLLLPLAEMDLDQFLRGKFSTIPEFSLADLIGEARNIVGALAFLHGMFQTDHRGLSCCHNDLKPANILVFREPDSSPVGTWKIADFGISVIAEPDEQPSTITGMSQEATPTVNVPPARPPSTYQAPEVSHGGQIGRKSDVWSVACILVRIMALGIEGLDGLKALDTTRGQPAVGEPEYGHDCFHRGSPPYLNPYVEQWLNALPERYTADSNDFWSQSSELLLSMLSISKRDRPSAKAVFDQLYQIEQHAPNYRRTSMSLTATPSTSNKSHFDSKSLRSTPVTSPSVRSQPLSAKYLVEAIVSGQIHDMKAILHTGVNVEEEYDGERPLLYAIKAKCVAAVEALQQYSTDLDVETPDKTNQTPLMLAAAQGDPEMVDILLSMGAHIDKTSQPGLTPLMLAAQRGHLQVAITLLNQDADCECYSTDGWNALHYAVYGDGDGDIIEPFVERMDVNSPTEGGGETPLLMLCKLYRDTEQWQDKFNALLSGRPDVNKTDVTEQHSPLSIAIEDNYVELAKQLVNECGATLPSIYHRRSSISRLSSDMASVVKGAKKREEPTPQRQSNTLSRTSTRFSGILRRSKS